MPHLTPAHLWELLPLTLLGFLGSFGHCVGMCGPLTVAFSLGQQQNRVPWRFHLLLNLGRVLSYTSVGVLLGTVSSTLVAGGPTRRCGELDSSGDRYLYRTTPDLDGVATNQP